MEKLCKHIEKLLAHHDYVVVPNLGGFVLQTQSAIVYSNRIVPPLSMLAFNPLMHHSDGLLAIEISRSELMSYRLAMEFIEKEISYLKNLLKNSGSVQFGNLGEFHQNETGNLTFTPSDNADFLPQNFLLFDVNTQTKESRRIVDKNKISIKLHLPNTYKYAAAMLIAGLFLAAPKVNDTRKANANLVSFPAKLIQNNSQSVKKQTKETIIQPSTETITQIETDTESKFHVVIASLATKESAELVCKSLSEDFKSVHVLSPSKTYRVAIQSFNDKTEAIEYMENLRKNDKRFETAWVLCN